MSTITKDTTTSSLFKKKEVEMKGPVSWKELNRIIDNNQWRTDIHGTAPRIDEQTELHNQHKIIVARNYVSMGDYILHTYFKGIPMAYQELNEGSKELKDKQSNNEEEEEGGLKNSQLNKLNNELIECKDVETESETDSNEDSNEELLAESSMSSISTDSNNGRLLYAVLDPDVMKRKMQHQFVENDYPYDLDPFIEHHLLFATKPIDSKKEVGLIIQQNLGHKNYLWWENPHQAKSIPNLWHIHIVSLHPKIQSPL